MEANHYSGIVSVRSGVNSDEAAPAAQDDGIESGPADWEACFYLHAATPATDSCTVTPYWWDDSAEKWVAGSSTAITGSQPYLMYTMGGLYQLRLTSVVGSYTLNVRTRGAG